MRQYLFYLEYDGKRTLASTYEAPVDVIHADGALSAINSFAARKKLKKVFNESLSDGSYRAYFRKKTFLRESQELIFYIKVE